MLGKKREEEIGGVKSILGEGLKIEGNVIAEGKIRIDGVVEGDVNGDFLIFGESAKVKGNVKAKNVVVMGSIEGNVETDKLEVKSSANVKGDISAKELAVEIGASISGRVSSGNYLSSNSETEE